LSGLVRMCQRRLNWSLSRLTREAKFTNFCKIMGPRKPGLVAKRLPAPFFLPTCGLRPRQHWLRCVPTRSFAPSAGVRVPPRCSPQLLPRMLPNVAGGQRRPNWACQPPGGAGRATPRPPNATWGLCGPTRGQLPRRASRPGRLRVPQSEDWTRLSGPHRLGSRLFLTSRPWPKENKQ
jgi:hypothetical protein